MALPAVGNQGTRIFVPAYVDRGVVQYRSAEEEAARQLKEAAAQAENRVKAAAAQAKARAGAARTPEQKDADARAVLDAYVEEHPVLRCPRCGFQVEKIGVTHKTRAFGRCLDEVAAKRSGMTADAIASYADARAAYLAANPTHANQI
jgi:hypothetical protein